MPLKGYVPPVSDEKMIIEGRFVHEYVYDNWMGTGLGKVVWEAGRSPGTLIHQGFNPKVAGAEQRARLLVKAEFIEEISK